MKYSNCQLVDSENPRILEIEDSDFSRECYKDAFHKFFKELGFGNARGSGNSGWRDGLRIYSIKLTANQYFRFQTNKTNVISEYSDDMNAFTSITKNTFSGFGPKGKKYFLNTLTIDGDKFVEYIKNKQEQKKEKRQNKTISKFRKDIILPWVTGNIQEVLPEFSQCYFGTGNTVYGSYSNKNITFRFNSVRMTQKQISEIDFDDIVFNIYLNIKNMSQSFDKELKVKMSGIKNLVSNFPDIEKEYRIRQVETEKEIRPVQDVVNSLYKEKKIVCEKIEKEKQMIETIREKSKTNFEKFLNELNLGQNN